ncbi:hypothetical protein DFJ74DRAFT_653493 [Hyaloraphidium curvatum]|nr:hypothetical protein DFJ74DRAFT_653493 [Hyaloraphidium curvatum]
MDPHDGGPPRDASHDPATCLQCRLQASFVYALQAALFGEREDSDSEMPELEGPPEPPAAPPAAVSGGGASPGAALPVGTDVTEDDRARKRVFSVDAKQGRRAPPVPRAPQVEPAPPAEPAPEVPMIPEAEELKKQGNAALAAEDFVGAIDAYTKAIECFPEPRADKRLAVLHSNLALAHQRFHNLGSAVLSASKAIELDPSYAKAYYRRGTVQKMLGKPREAYADFRTLLALEPHNREVLSLMKDLELEVRKLGFSEAISGGKAETAAAAAKRKAAAKKPEGRDWNTTASLAVLAARRIAEEVSKLPEEFAPFLEDIDEVYVDKIVAWLDWPTMQSYKQSGALGGRFASTKVNELIKAQDDFHRTLFASDREHPIIRDPHLSLLNPFEPAVQPFLHYNKPDYEDVALPRLFSRHIKREGLAVVPKLDEFESKVDVFTGGQLRYLDWSNVFLAGGAALAALVPTPGGVLLEDYYLSTPMHASADVDLFIYGVTVDEANAKLRQIFGAIEKAVKEQKPKSRVIAVRTQHTCTFVSDYPFRHVQVVLRIYKSPAEILMGFDVDACCAGYDGTNAWINARCARALTTQSNMVDLSRRSPSYELRLFKYAKRGFSIVVPDLDKDRVKKFPDHIWGWHRRKEKGLGLLCMLEHLWLNPEKSRQSYAGLNHFDVDSEIFFSGDHTQGARPRDPDKAISDYDSIKLPFGPKYRLSDIERRIHDFSWSANNWYRKEMACIDLDDEVEAVLWGSIDKVLDGRLRLVPSGATRRYPKIIRADSMWLTTNPGTQQKMLSGSFNPIPDDTEAWYRSAYEDVPEK